MCEIREKMKTCNYCEHISKYNIIQNKYKDIAVRIIEISEKTKMRSNVTNYEIMMANFVSNNLETGYNIIPDGMNAHDVFDDDIETYVGNYREHVRTTSDPIVDWLAW